MPKIHIARWTIWLAAEPSARRMLGDWHPVSTTAATMTAAATAATTRRRLVPAL